MGVPCFQKRTDRYILVQGHHALQVSSIGNIGSCISCLSIRRDTHASSVILLRWECNADRGAVQVGVVCTSKSGRRGSRCLGSRRPGSSLSVPKGQIGEGQRGGGRFANE